MPLFLGGILKKVAGIATSFIPGGGIVRNVARVAGGVIRSLGGSRTARAAGAGAVTTLATQNIARRFGRPPPRPTFAGFTPPQGRRPAGPVTRAVQRLVPGGRTGRELVPIGDAEDKFGRPLLVGPDMIERVYCPPGYVKVTMPDGSIACALKGPARAAGLYRSPRKPPISAGDWHRLQVAERVKKKAKRIASTAGFTTSRKGASRRGSCG